MASNRTLVELVKKNLVITHHEDDALVTHVLEAVTSYATDFQHQPQGHYQSAVMSGLTKQAIIMFATHFFESRDGSTAVFWNTQPNATILFRLSTIPGVVVDERIAVGWNGGEYRIESVEVMRGRYVDILAPASHPKNNLATRR